MEFIVIGRLIDAPVAPPQVELALLKASFAGFGNGQDPRIKAVYPYADQRATAFVIEAASGEELSDIIASFPASRLSTWEAHPTTTPARVLSQLEGWERALAPG